MPVFGGIFQSLGLSVGTNQGQYPFLNSGKGWGQGMVGVALMLHALGYFVMLTFSRYLIVFIKHFPLKNSILLLQLLELYSF